MNLVTQGPRTRATGRLEHLTAGGCRRNIGGAATGIPVRVKTIFAQEFEHALHPVAVRVNERNEPVAATWLLTKH